MNLKLIKIAVRIAGLTSVAVVLWWLWSLLGGLTRSPTVSNLVIAGAGLLLWIESEVSWRRS